jgi:hypothetical protein
MVVRCPFKMASITFQGGSPILCYEGGDTPGFWADDPTKITNLASTEHAAEEHKLYCLGLSLNDKEQLGTVIKSSEENGHFLRIGFFYSTNMKFNEASDRNFTIK